MPHAAKPVDSWILPKMFRYLTAFLALYAVVAKATSESNRSNNQSLALSIENKGFDLAAPEYYHPVPVLETRLGEPLAEISPELLKLSQESKSDPAKIADYKKLYFREAEGAIRHHRWSELNKILNDLPSPVKPDVLRSMLKKRFFTEFEHIWTTFIEKLDYRKIQDFPDIFDKRLLQSDFSDWWEQNNIAGLLEIQAFLAANIPTYKNKPGMNIEQFIYMFGTTKHFEHLLMLKKVEWKNQIVRLIIFRHDENGEKIKMLYDWSINQGYGNIFTSDAPLSNTINIIHNEEGFFSFKRNKEKIVKLDRAGIINVKRELNISIDKLFALDLASLKKIAKERANISYSFNLNKVGNFSDVLAHDDIEAVKRLIIIPPFYPAYNERLCLFAAKAIELSKWKIAKGISEISEFKPSEGDKQKLKAAANEKLSEALASYVVAQHNIRKHSLTGAELVAQFQSAFSRWWDEKAIEVLLTFHADPTLSVQSDYSLINVLSANGKAEHFDVLFKIHNPPLNSPEYGVLRSNIFMRINELELVEKIYQYGLSKWGINIFDLPAKDNLNPLLLSLQIFIAEHHKATVADSILIANVKKTYTPYEVLGITNFKSLFGKTSNELFSQEPEAVIKEVEDKIKSVKQAHSRVSLISQIWGQAKDALTILTLILLFVRYSKWHGRDAAPAIENAAQPERRRPRRDSGPRPALVPVPEDPQAEQRRALESESTSIEALIEQIAKSKQETETRSKLEWAVPEYADLIAAYDNSLTVHRDLLNAINSAFNSLNDQNLENVRVARAGTAIAIIACAEAQGRVRAAENVRAEKTKEAELQVSHQAQQQAVSSKEQSLVDIITKFTELKGQDNKPLVKLNQLNALIEQAHTLGFEPNKLKPKLAPLSHEIERLQKQVDEQISALKSKEVFALVKDVDLPVVKRIEKIKAFRLQSEAIGQYEKPLDNEYRRSTELLKDLVGERQQYFHSMYHYCNRIESLAKQTNLPLRERLDQTKKYQERTQELMFQLGLSQEQVETITEVPVLEIIEDLQKQYDIENGWESFVRINPEHADLFYTVRDLCHRINQELNSLELQKQTSDEASLHEYMASHQVMALCFNLARLFDQLSSIWPDLLNVRHHLTHHFYLSKDKPAALLALAQEVADEKKLLKQLHLKLRAKDNELESQIKDSDYFKAYCTKSSRFEDSRLVKSIVGEVRECLEALQDFVNNIDVMKGPDLSADSKGLLADHARMAVNILCHDLLGERKSEVASYLEAQGMTSSNIHKLFKFMGSYELRILRNKTMHGPSVDASGGLVAVKSDLDGMALKTISIELHALRELLNKPVVRTSLALGSLGAAGGIGLRADAHEWNPPAP